MIAPNIIVLDRLRNGAIFVQTVSDYPLVEAIHQGVVQHPVLPDAASRERLHDEKYADYLALGVEEWKKSYAEHEPMGKKAVLFVMVDDTRNCDDVAAHLERICPELQGAGLVIHTKKNGDIAEAASGKGKHELELLRRQANQIDHGDSKYKAIVSVLMLKEGWDVRNVTIVGLRAYAAKSNILPEQTLGRGLRRMYFGTDTPETVSVMGTPAFMEFVETIRSEGVELEHVPMGGGARREDSLVVEVETGHPAKNIDALDIALPRLARRFQREYKNLDALDALSLAAERLPLKPFTPEQTRDIIFKTMLDGEAHHTMALDGAGVGDGRSVIAYFARQLLKELRLVGGYELLYGQVKTFVRERLFGGGPVDIDDPVVLRNLSESAAAKRVFDTFKAATNVLTVQDSGSSRIEGHIRLRDVRPFRTQHREWLPVKRSVSSVSTKPANSSFCFRFGTIRTHPSLVRPAMSALVIKNLPDDVLTRLKERAKANHRSLTKEAIVLLSNGVGQATPLPRARAALPPPYALPGGPLSIGDLEDAIHARTDDPWPAPDGREALRAALVKQPDGSYINVLGIDDESFFKTLESVRSEIRSPEAPDFGDESH